MIKSNPLPALFLRFALFGIFQCLLACVFFLTKTNAAWYTSQGWWIVSGFSTNIVTFIVLKNYFKNKRIRYFDNFKFVRKSWWKDILILIGILLITFPISTYPNTYLAQLLYGSTDITFHLFFRSIPFWLIVLGFFWAISQGLVELPFYFAYLMPQLETKLNNGWKAWLLASFFLAFQHTTLPLIFDVRFMFWRLGMFLPFAFFVGLCLKLRPRLFPYLMIIHALMDIGAVAVFFTLK